MIIGSWIREIQVFNKQVVKYDKIISHFRKVVGALAIFDLTNKVSFEKLSIWITALRKEGDSDIQILLVGNKLDLIEKNISPRQVSDEEIKAFAKTNKCKSLEISANDQNNVIACFELLFSGN